MKTNSYLFRHFPRHTCLAPSPRLWVLIAFIILSILDCETTPLSATNPVFAFDPAPLKADVTILALSTVVRTPFSNEDIYLATVHLKGHLTILAKLADTFPRSGQPIRRGLLEDHQRFQMMLVRSPDRDLPGNAFFLSRNRAFIFDASAVEEMTIHPPTTLPCFSVIHQKIRLISPQRVGHRT